MATWHRIIFGDCRDMKEIPDNSIHLVVTSPPYYNAPFDYPDLFHNYGEFLQLLRDLAKELKRVLAKGRIACFVTDDMLVNGEKYPIVADLTRIMVEEGFRYRDRIIWKKPEGYIRISRRSGVLIQHPYPMYFYPDNIHESILIFQKGKYDYSNKERPQSIIEDSRIDIKQYLEEKWYLSVWDITNVLPLEGRLEEGIAAFPEEIPRRLIRLFTFVGETVLDPFLGSGTTVKVARELGRNSYGYEIDLELKPIILKKIGYNNNKEDNAKLTLFTDSITVTTPLAEDRIEVIERNDTKHLRTFLQKKLINKQQQKKKSVTRKAYDQTLTADL
ncbi:MAG: site-specific DNA-methyltransferase [Candidatus Anstonellales archaeon]